MLYVQEVWTNFVVTVYQIKFEPRILEQNCSMSNCNCIFWILSYDIKRVKISWTHSNIIVLYVFVIEYDILLDIAAHIRLAFDHLIKKSWGNGICIDLSFSTAEVGSYHDSESKRILFIVMCTLCPRRSYPFYTANYNING